MSFGRETLYADDRRMMRARIAIEGAGGDCATADRLRVLDAIAETGSITGAGRRLGLTYRSAWEAVQRLNAVFGRPLVAASMGGSGGGGGARLTEAGERVRAELAVADREMRRRVERLQADLAAPDAGASRTSDEAAWPAVVTNMTADEVQVHTAGGTTVVAGAEAAEDADPRPGDRVQVVIPSQAVLLASEAIRCTSARNCWPVQVADRREAGASGVRLDLAVGEGDRLSAVLTRESADRLNLTPGAGAWAIVKASQIALRRARSPDAPT